MENIFSLLINIKELFTQNLLFGLSILLIGGFVFGKLVQKIKLPSITGYILAGLILGQSVLGLVPELYTKDVYKYNDNITTQEEHIEYHEETKDLSEETNNKNGHHSQHDKHNPLGNITQIALGLIAVTIGGEFGIGKLKKSGKAVLVLTIIQLVLSFSIVTILLVIFKFDIFFSLILGAIASATAPAATVAIIQSLNAKGQFVDYLYGIVALDDAGAVILFGIVFSITSSVIGSAVGQDISALNIIIHSFFEVIFSVLTGIILGFILHFLLRKGKRKNTNEQLIISLSIIFISSALAVILHLSPILTNMILGATLINLSERNERIFNLFRPLSPPIYAVFFAIAGTELNIAIFTTDLSVLVFGIIFVIARAIGKYGGIYLGALIVKTEKNVKNYLGFSMLPQAGVAIGLTLLLESSQVMASTPVSADYVSKVISIVLFSVFINEIIGPPLSKMAVIKGTGIKS